MICGPSARRQARRRPPNRAPQARAPAAGDLGLGYSSRPGQVFILWGFAYNFTDYNFRKTVDLRLKACVARGMKFKGVL